MLFVEVDFLCVFCVGVESAVCVGGERLVFDGDVYLEVFCARVFVEVVAADYREVIVGDCCFGVCCWF